MGTINYNSSNYITIGYDLSIDIEEDIENGYTEEELKELYIEDARFIIGDILAKYDFYYYHVTIIPGYYEGFSIDIECNYNIAWDDCYQKRKAQKEITKLKKFLLECLDYDLCVVHPGWCTSYLNYDDSVKEINAAILEIRDEAKSTPTWAQYERSAK